MKKDKAIIIPEDERQIEKTIRILTDIEKRTYEQFNKNVAKDIEEAKINNQDSRALQFAIKVLEDVSAFGR